MGNGIKTASRMEKKRKTVIQISARDTRVEFSPSPGWRERGDQNRRKEHTLIGGTNIFLKPDILFPKKLHIPSDEKRQHSLWTRELSVSLWASCHGTL
ncbi:hypothetical protein CDAR_442981 [Caerostris darwini]|uniref:Uncharacterized protein n=1 Tax=Caerostris darwini TaxID=1538125 RepID=A0AAV4VP64_9ARAC|nr:hypothetical protein CDAR_442981 [Caerostris darwini]